MKKIVKSIISASDIVAHYESRYTFTATELNDILLQLKELRNYNIFITEIQDGILQLTIGDSVYQISDEPIR